MNALAPQVTKAVASDATQMVAASDTWERKVRRRWDAVIAWLRGQWSIAEVESMLAARDFQPMLDGLARAAESLAAVTAAAYTAAAEVAMGTVRRAIRDPFASFVRKDAAGVEFEQTNARAVAHLRREKLRLVREVTEAQREAWTEAIAAGMQRGDNPRAIAREIRASLGLTARQERAVANYRRLLEEGSAEALTRELRDRRYDGKVRRAIEGKPLASADVDRMVDRYRQRYISYRAEVIARTEALRAVHEGAEEAYRQAIDSGNIAAQDVERTWVTAGGVTRKGKPRTRHSHRAMSGQKRKLGEPFRSGYGYTLRYPGDINAPASETVQCRCAVTTRIRPSAPSAPPADVPVAVPNVLRPAPVMPSPVATVSPPPVPVPTPAPVVPPLPVAVPLPAYAPPPVMAPPPPTAPALPTSPRRPPPKLPPGTRLVDLPPPPPSRYTGAQRASYKQGALDNVKHSIEAWDDYVRAYPELLPELPADVPQGMTYGAHAFAQVRMRYAQTLPEQHHQAALYYTHQGDQVLNSSLREGLFNREPDVQRIAGFLDDAIAAYKMPRETYVKRGIGGPWASHLARTLEVDDVFSDPGYVSTSAVNEFQKPVRLRIRVPKGANAAPIPSFYADEYEYLLPRDSYFRVLSKRQDADGVWHMELELVP